MLAVNGCPDSGSKRFLTDISIFIFYIFIIIIFHKICCQLIYCILTCWNHLELFYNQISQPPVGFCKSPLIWKPTPACTSIPYFRSTRRVLARIENLPVQKLKWFSSSERLNVNRAAQAPMARSPNGWAPGACFMAPGGGQGDKAPWSSIY